MCWCENNFLEYHLTRKSHWFSIEMSIISQKFVAKVRWHDKSRKIISLNTIYNVGCFFLFNNSFHHFYAASLSLSFSSFFSYFLKILYNFSRFRPKDEFSQNLQQLLTFEAWKLFQNHLLRLLSFTHVFFFLSLKFWTFKEFFLDFLTFPMKTLRDFSLNI